MENIDWKHEYNDLVGVRIGDNGVTLRYVTKRYNTGPEQAYMCEPGGEVYSEDDIMAVVS